jgi:hypothetical protein
MDEHNGPAGGQSLLNCKILTLAAIVALRGVMTIPVSIGTGCF